MTRKAKMTTSTALEDTLAGRAIRAAKAAEAAEAAGKAKAAQEVLMANDAAYRNFVKFQNFTGNAALKRNEVTQACLKAIGQNISHWLDAQSEELRAGFFAAIEFGATQADATRIAKHPLRPAVVTGMVDAMIIKAAADEAEKRAEAEAASPDADTTGTSDAA